MNKEEKEAIKELIDSSNLSLIGDGTMIVKNTTIATILNYIDKLQKELKQERKLTNLIIKDFQVENYFINMTNKEVREYYSKRKELK